MRAASLVGIIAIALLAACSKEPAPAPAAPPKAAYGSFGVDLAQMDTSVKPGEDFFRYVNGKWLDSFQMPADRAGYGTGTVVFEKTEADLHAILDELAASKPAAGSVEQKVADMYAELDGRSRDRGARTRAAAALPGADQCGQGQGGPDAAGRLGRFSGAVRLVHQARHGGSDQVHRVGRSVGARHAEPRLLPQEGRQVRRLSRGLCSVRHQSIRAARQQGSGRLGQTGDRHREQDRGRCLGAGASAQSQRSHTIRWT